MELLKYSSLVTYPLLAIGTLWVIRRAKGFNHKKTSFSNSIHNITSKRIKFLFCILFPMKGILDLLFSYYIIQKLSLSLNDIATISLITYSLLFSSLAFIREDNYSRIHVFIAYLSGVLWFIGSLRLTYLIASPFFFTATCICFVIPVFISFACLFLKKLTMPIQAGVVTFMFVWSLLFVLLYL